MRRIIHNTTAIAACLSLLAPQVVLAQSPEAEGSAQGQQQQQPAGQQTQPAAEQPAAEQPTEGAGTGAACADGTQPPCAAIAPAAPAQPEAASPQPAEAEAAPPEASPAQTELQAAPPAGQPEASGAADATAAPPVDPQAAQPTDAPGVPEAVESAPAAGSAAETAAPEAEAAQSPVTADQPAEAATPAPQDSIEARPEPAPAEPAPTEDGLAEALSKEAGETAPQAPEGQPQDAEGAMAPAPAAGAAAEVEGDAAPETAEPAPLPEGNAGQPAAPEGGAAAQTGDPATDADALADALAKKNGEEVAPAEEPAAPPAADPQVNEAQQAAPPAAQPQPEAPAVAPEQEVKETAAATEAAAAQEVAPVAALSDEGGGGEVTEEQVTEDNSRSSAEDFATDLRDAMTAATGTAPREAAEDDDDDDNDLAKALLFGLGGVAVGSMLNNNRQVTLSTPDRVVVTRADGSQQIIKDEVALLRQPGSTVATENYNDGSSRTIVTRADGSRIVTIRDADLRVLRRDLVSPDGTTTQLIDDTVRVDPVDIASLPAPAAGTGIVLGQSNEEELRAALFRETDAGRRFTLSQVRNIPQVRALAAPVNIDAITFETGSAAIQPSQAEQLSALGKVIRGAIAENPREMFLIEGHTDTVGSDAANLALSDRRAESVALALTEYFKVPPENMVVQGYGEQFLRLRQEGDVRENRRAAVRRVTDLLQQASR